METDIKLLQQIYKFDINLLIETIDASNFTIYFNLVNDLLQLVDVNEDFKQELCDKILLMCLELLFKDERKSIEILNFLKISIQYVSFEKFEQAMHYFVYYLVKFVQLYDDGDLKSSMPAFLNEFASQWPNFFHQIEYTNSAQVLNGLLSILLDNLLKFKSQVSKQNYIGKLRSAIQFLIDYCLGTLNTANTLSLIQISINTIDAIMKLTDDYKHGIMQKYYVTMQRLYASLDVTTLKTDRKRLESHCEDANIYFLASIADYYISHSDGFGYINKHEYWYLVQNSLVHTNTLTRKRGLYLLKRIIDYANVNSIGIYADDAMESVETGHIQIFDSKSTVWNDFFLCIELFEETSVCIDTCLVLFESPSAYCKYTTH